MRRRFYEKDALENLLGRVEKTVETAKAAGLAPDNIHLDDEEFTKARMEDANKLWGHDDEWVQ